MVDRCVVWSDVGGTAVRVGQALHSGRQGEFNYVDPYLEAAGLAIDPINLPTAKGQVYRTLANNGVFGVLDDAGPDAWGKRVLKALKPDAFAKAGPLDILLLSSGYGIGSLMFSKSATTRPLRHSVASRADLGAAAEAAHAVEMGEVPAAHLRELLRPAVSAGGMHPKIPVSDPDGTEWIAKFRSAEDLIDTPRIEFATMRLAGLHCGINAAHVELSAFAERAAVLVRRFDRERGIEHYASAAALWNRQLAAADAPFAWASYAGIVELRQGLPGAGVADDAKELFRRMVLNVIIGNTDDHGRNHGFLMTPRGEWRLSPAFDVLPSMRGPLKVHALGVGPRGQLRSFENVLEGAAAFGLDTKQAVRAVKDIALSVRTHYPTLLKEARCSAADEAAVLGRCIYPPTNL